MRTDFDKVLTEDPRRGSRNKFSSIRRSKDNAFFDEEFSGGKESMKAQRRRQRKINRKTFGDHLGPLRRFLESSVGKNWDDVHSEMCRLFDKRGQMNFHVHAHTFQDFVETNTRLIDGKVCTFSGYNGWEPVEERSWFRRRLYVHPVTRVLCNSYKQKEAAPEKTEAEKLADLKKYGIRHSDEEHLYFENGIWYVCTMKDVPPAVREVYRPYHVPQAEYDQMELSDKLARGLYRWVRPPYTIAHRGGTWLPNGKYYDTKLPASRKYLKAHGLVGTAEFIEPEEGLSARERSKYRAA